MPSTGLDSGGVNDTLQARHKSKGVTTTERTGENGRLMGGAGYLPKKKQTEEKDIEKRTWRIRHTESRGFRRVSSRPNWAFEWGNATPTFGRRSKRLGERTAASTGGVGT